MLSCAGADRLQTGMRGAFGKPQVSGFMLNLITTDKSFSEALILESVKPQYYDERLFIEFPEKYKFTICQGVYFDIVL